MLGVVFEIPGVFAPIGPAVDPPPVLLPIGVLAHKFPLRFWVAARFETARPIGQTVHKFACKISAAPVSIGPVTVELAVRVLPEVMVAVLERNILIVQVFEFCHFSI